MSNNQNNKANANNSNRVNLSSNNQAYKSGTINHGNQSNPNSPKHTPSKNK